MQLNRPVLDDRSFEELKAELIERIPVYAPEWTDHNPSDPGITLLELFSFLGENLLYRFNQIPEATKLEFLRLLQIPLRRAEPARAMVTFTTRETGGVRVEKASRTLAGDIAFETLDEVRVLPLTAFGVGKMAQEAPQEDSEEAQFFQQAYRSRGLETAGEAAPYSVKMLWAEEPGQLLDFDEAVDGILWVPVLAEKPALVAAVRQALAAQPQAPLLNLGFVPDARLEKGAGEATGAEFPQRFRCPGAGRHEGEGPAVQWQIWSGIDADMTPQYRALGVEGDSTAGLSREGVVRLRLPADIDGIGNFPIDDPDALGTGDLPPPLADDYEARLVCWLRAFRHDGSRLGRLRFVGANAVRAEQTERARAEFLGTGNGQPNQVFKLVHGQVLPDSLVLEVEETGGWRQWRRVEGFFASGESDRHFSLDAAAGRVKFGDGLRGFVPQIGQRIRVLEYRHGGGAAGNVAAAAIDKLQPGKPVKVENPLPAYGGAEPEPLARALERIPGELRRRDRAVTAGDFRELALQAPGANIARAECLPRYHPALPERESPGVVSVLVLPAADPDRPNAPMPDRNQIAGVCRYLDARRLVTTELYVIPPSYRPVAVAVGLVVKPGYGTDAVRHWVELVIRQYLAPLPPYGPEGGGWPLGRPVYGPELEAAALQVEGVEYLEGLKLVGWDGKGQRIDDSGRVPLARNQLPELIGITVEQGPVTLDPGEAIAPRPAEKPPVPVPVLLEEC